MERPFRHQPVNSLFPKLGLDPSSHDPLGVRGRIQKTHSVLFVLVPGIFILGLAYYGMLAHYVSSGRAESAAQQYGCLHGAPQRATCRMCSGSSEACCDLRCPDGDKRLRCTPMGGCTLAPDIEVNVTNYESGYNHN